MRKECRIWKNEQNNLKKENKETNAIVVEGDIAIVTDDGCVSLATQDSNWVIDSGALFHITSHSDFFTSYRTCDAPNPGGPLTTRQPAKYLCLIPRDSYMSKNGHIGLHIILIKIQQTILQ